MISKIIEDANQLDLLCCNGLHSEAIDACNALIKTLEDIREIAVINAKKENEIKAIENTMNYVNKSKETESD